MTENKKFDELTTKEVKELKIEFAPGCFDNFEGSQEELDELVNQIKEMFASGQALELARPLEFSDLDEDDIEILEQMVEQEEVAKGRKLQ